MAEKSTPRVLVIDGYTQEAREVLKAGGASIAADLYRGMLEACAPFAIECEYCFPSDSDCEIPTDSALDRFDGRHRMVLDRVHLGEVGNELIQLYRERRLSR